MTQTSVTISSPTSTQATPRAVLLVCALIFAILLAWLLAWPWSGEGDAVSHYLLARQSLHDPSKAMSAFARPLHKLLLVFPAQGGNTCARIFSALVTVACVWQTIRLAEDLKIRNSLLAAPLLLLQPYAFALASDTMTELPMALGIVVAIRLWIHGRYLASALLVSFLPALRPEGAFLIVLWAVIILCNRHIGTWRRRFAMCASLAVGPLCWAVSATIATRDPLYIYHAWFWSPDSSSTLGRGPLLHYFYNRREYFGGILYVPFLIGIIPSIRRSMALPWAVFLLVLVLHSVLFWLGKFGSLGLLRWIVPTAPLGALVMLYGCNLIAEVLPLRRFTRPAIYPLLAVALLLALAHDIAFYISSPYRYHGFAIRKCVSYIKSQRLLDGAPMAFIGDAIAYAELDPPPSLRFANASDDHDQQLRYLRDLPAGSIGVWDDQQSLMWHRVSIEELQRNGFTVLFNVRMRTPSIPGLLKWGQISYTSQRFVVLRKDSPLPPSPTRPSTQPALR